MFTLAPAAYVAALHCTALHRAICNWPGGYCEYQRVGVSKAEQRQGEHAGQRSWRRQARVYLYDSHLERNAYGLQVCFGAGFHQLRIKGAHPSPRHYAITPSRSTAYQACQEMRSIVHLSVHCVWQAHTPVSAERQTGWEDAALCALCENMSAP